MFSFTQQALVEKLEKEKEILSKNLWLSNVLTKAQTVNEAFSLIHTGCGGIESIYRERSRLYLKLYRGYINPVVSSGQSMSTSGSIVFYPFSKEMSIGEGRTRIPCALLDQCLTKSPVWDDESTLYLYTATIRNFEDNFLGKYREPSVFDWIGGICTQRSQYIRRVLVVKALREKLSTEDGYLDLPPSVLECIVTVSSSKTNVQNSILLAVAIEDLKTASVYMSDARIIKLITFVRMLIEQKLAPAELYNLVRNGPHGFGR